MIENSCIIEIIIMKCIKIYLQNTDIQCGVVDYSGGIYEE